MYHNFTHQDRVISSMITKSAIQNSAIIIIMETNIYDHPNLVPRVFRLFGQRGNAGKTLGTSNFITAGFLR